MATPIDISGGFDPTIDPDLLLPPPPGLFVGPPSLSDPFGLGTTAGTGAAPITTAQQGALGAAPLAPAQQEALGVAPLAPSQQESLGVAPAPTEPFGTTPAFLPPPPPSGPAPTSFTMTPEQQAAMNAQLSQTAAVNATPTAPTATVTPTTETVAPTTTEIGTTPPTPETPVVPPVPPVMPRSQPVEFTPPTRLPPSLEGYTPGPARGMPNFAAAFGGASQSPRSFGPNLPGAINSRQAIPLWARGLQRSPYARFSQGQNPLAPTTFGRFTPPDELLDEQQQGLPAWAVLGG